MTNLSKEVFNEELTCEPPVEIAHRIGPVPRQEQRDQAKEKILKLARSVVEDFL